LSKQTKYRKLSEQLQLPLFFQPWWLDMVSDEWKAVVTEQDGNVQAVWPYSMEKKAGVSIIRNPLMTPYLGPYFFLPGNLKQSKRFTKEDEIYKAIWKQFSDWDFFDVQCLPDYNNFLPFQHEGFTHTQKITYEVDLTQTEEEILNGMDEGKRRHIRKAAKELTITDGLPFLEQFYHLHKDTFVRKGKKYPCSQKLFKKIITTSIEHKAGNLSAAVNAKGELNALLFVVYDHEKMYLLISAVNQDVLHHGAMVMLVWEAMKLGKKLKLKTFDFEGSTDPGVELYFRNFGGERKTYLSCTCNRSKLWKLKRALLG
jgi:hypothetical protein